MTPTARISPLAQVVADRRPELGTVQGMAIPARFPAERDTWKTAIGICDLSALVRAGLKGPGAEAWLAARHVPVPAAPNSWIRFGGGLVARLARTEFLIEDGFHDAAAIRLRGELQPGEPGVYPVIRQDCALALAGPAVPELLVQTCNVDFAAQPVTEPIVTLTQMVGVGVTVLRDDRGDVPCYRVWCDGTMGPYLWETLSGIAEELGGGPVGVARLFGDAAI